MVKYIKKLTDYFKKEWLTFAGALTGSVAGYLYWYFIGCNSGTCPITSNPTNSTLYGTLLGTLIFNLFRRDKK